MVKSFQIKKGQVKHFPCPEARSGPNLALLHIFRVSHNALRPEAPMDQQEEVGWNALDTTRHNISYNIQKQKAGLYSRYDRDRVKGPCQPSREHVLLCLFMAGRIPKAHQPQHPQVQMQTQGSAERCSAVVCQGQHCQKIFYKIWHYRECSAPGHQGRRLQWWEVGQCPVLHLANKSSTPC